MCPAQCPLFLFLAGQAGQDGQDGQDGEDGVGEHGECDVLVPAHVAAHFVLAKVAFVLRALEAFLDLPAATGDAYEVGDGGFQGCAGEVVGALVGLDAVAAGRRPALPGGFGAVEFPHDRQAGCGPVVESLALRAASCGLLLPGFGRGLADEVIDARAVDLLGLGYGDDVEEAVVFEEAAEMGVLAVSRVRGDSADGRG